MILVHDPVQSVLSAKEVGTRGIFKVVADT